MNCELVMKKKNLFPMCTIQYAKSVKMNESNRKLMALHCLKVLLLSENEFFIDNQRD